MSFDDKRQSVRAASEVKGVIVEYIFTGTEMAHRIAFLKNISAVGLSIYVTEEIPEGTHLDLLVYFLGISDPVSVGGVVVWERPSDVPTKSGRERFDLGISFTEITKEEKGRLAHYIEQLI